MLKTTLLDFPGGPVIKNLPANAGDMGSIPVRSLMQEDPMCCRAAKLVPQLLKTACSGAHASQQEKLLQ